jgi:hypothetical protein
MKESIKFIVENKTELDILKKIVNENNDIEIVNNGDKNNNKVKNEIIFKRDKTSLEQQMGIMQLLYVIIGGGGITTIIKCITDVIEKYLKYSKGKIKISKGDSTIEFEYKLSKRGELIINEELIRNIILSEDKKEQTNT